MDAKIGTLPYPLVALLSRRGRLFCGRSHLITACSVAILLATLALSSCPILASEPQCPEGSTKVREEAIGKDVRIYCKCLPGRLLIDHQCVQLRPVETEEFEARTGKAFQVGQELRDYAAKASDWSTRVKATFVAGIVEAERGMYDRATYLLAQVRGKHRDSAVIDDGLEQLKRLTRVQKVRAASGPYVQEIVRPEDLDSLPLKAKTRVLMAAASVSVGDYEEGLRLLQEALKEAPGTKSLNDAALYVGQLKACEDLLIDVALEGGKSPDRFAAARIRAKAMAAHKLGLYLAERGDYQGAVRYFQEALEVDWGSMEKGVIHECTAHVKNLPSDAGFPVYRSKADALLDALEYGKGNWEESLRYLDIAYGADPVNLQVRDARSYLRGLHAGLQLGGQR